MRRTLRLLWVVMVCLGVVAVAHAAPSPDELHDLLLATAHAPMKGSLRGALTKILNAARGHVRAGQAGEASDELAAYVALLAAQTGTGITAAAAAPLIAAAEEALSQLVGYPFAADYADLPVVGGSPGLTVRDWRPKGVVTGVGNQGQCGADYAFSAIGAVESAWAIQKGQLINLSEQQIVDCDAASAGCDGGSPVRALEFGLDHGGFVTEQSYPYTARDGSCKSATPVVTIGSLARTAPGDEVALQWAVDTFGPVSVVLRVPGAAWDGYAGGLFDPATALGGASRFVAALIVGFADQGGTPYWIVKASNGTDWGEGGYVRIPRGQNAFGISDYAVVPEV